MASNTHRPSAVDQALYEEAVLTPPNGVTLIRTPRDVHLQRMMTPDQDIAELFHENSKITRNSVRSMPMDADALASTRDWYFDTAYHQSADDLDFTTAQTLGVRRTVETVGPALSAMLADLASDEGIQDVLYALDLWFLFDASLYRLPPRSQMLWLEQILSDDDKASLTDAVPALRMALSEADAVLFAGIAPHRYMALQGVRGYRRCLIDCGRFAQWCRDRAMVHNVEISVIYDYCDTQLDNLLMLDGVERSVAMVLAVAATHVDTP